LGFLLLLPHFGSGLLLFITEGIIRRPVTMGQIIIMVRLVSGSRATGKTDGLLRVGKGSGFQVTGNIVDKRKGVKPSVHSLSFSDVVLLRLLCGSPLSGIELRVRLESSKT